MNNEINHDMTGKIIEGCEYLKEMLIKKNDAYGASVFKSSPLASVEPEMACYVRMGDKINRLKNLLSGEDDNGESINDTLLDLAGYCLMACLIRNEK